MGWSAVRHTLTMYFRTGVVGALLICLACAGAEREPEMIQMGCGDGSLVSCDNQPSEPRNRCNPDFDHQPGTIALYDRREGDLIGRLRDPGTGIPYEAIEEAGTWMRIRTCDEVDPIEGWVNWEEGFSSRLRIRFR